MKKTLSLAVMFCLIVSLFSGLTVSADEVTLTGTGTADNPYQIATAADFAAIANDLNAYYQQTADIEGVNAGISGDFAGTYDGNGRTITVAIDVTDVNAGLFACVNGGTVKNLTVAGSVKGTKSSVNIYVGGIAAVAKGAAVFENCYNKASVQGTNQVGGIVAQFSDSVATGAKINLCRNEGTITGWGRVGGIVGQIKNAALTNCENEGTVTGSNKFVGGIAGWCESNVASCYNIGDITGTTGVGGIIGDAYKYSTNVQYCYNLGTIKATDPTGVAAGLAGYKEATNLYVKNSYNAGEVISPKTKKQDLGVDGTTYTSCYALTANAAADGLSGISGVTAVTPAALKTADLGSAYTTVDASAAYPYPQLKNNPQTTAWDFALLTVSAGENGTASFVGSKYVKDGISYSITFTPDENYKLDKVLINEVEQPDSGETLSIPISGDTTISAAFAVIPVTEPTIAQTYQEAFTSTADVTINEQTIKGPKGIVFAKVADTTGYTLKECGMEFALSENALLNNEGTRYQSTKQSAAGNYGICFFGNFVQGITYYARPYAIYKNTENDAEVIVFGDTIAFKPYV